VVQSGITRVVVATRDPNPRVMGRGLAALRRAGLKVVVGPGREEANRLIEPYRTRMLTGRPLVTLKVASTLDGKIATAQGESRWITGPRARRKTQLLRAQSDAILVGIGTVLGDDPSLTVRMASSSGRNPLRIILDPSLRIPLRAKVLTDGQAKTVIVTTAAGPAAKRTRLVGMGADVLVLPARHRRISWPIILRALGRRGIASLLIEGGAEVNASVLKAGVVDRVLFFLAPRILGGRDALSAVGGMSPARLDRALSLKEVTVTRIGGDILVSGRLCR
jgi:diaminohydroxyphosphoribosylaminopyrimidine deaminase/5-amino-6-(5-phosphoribosylamino)uracil reductase